MLRWVELIKHAPKGQVYGLKIALGLGVGLALQACFFETGFRQHVEAWELSQTPSLSLPKSTLSKPFFDSQGVFGAQGCRLPCAHTAYVANWALGQSKGCRFPIQLFVAENPEVFIRSAGPLEPMDPSPSSGTPPKAYVSRRLAARLDLREGDGFHVWVPWPASGGSRPFYGGCRVFPIRIAGIQANPDFPEGLWAAISADGAQQAGLTSVSNAIGFFPVDVDELARLRVALRAAGLAGAVQYGDGGGHRAFKQFLAVHRWWSTLGWSLLLGCVTLFAFTALLWEGVHRETYWATLRLLGLADSEVVWACRLEGVGLGLISFALACSWALLGSWTLYARMSNSEAFFPDGFYLAWRAVGWGPWLAAILGCLSLSVWVRAWLQLFLAGSGRKWGR